MNDHRKIPSEFGQSDSSALDWARETGVGEQVIRRTEARVRRQRRRRAALAGSFAIAILMGALGTDLWRSPRGAVAPRQGAAVVSQPVQRVLADGSVVELKSDAEIAVDFAGPQRRVKLTRGDAHFQVTQDAARPFVVAVDGVEIRAVGTAFSVGFGQQVVEVVVTEGRVSISSPSIAQSAAESPIEPAFVDAGNRAVVEVGRSGGARNAPQITPVSQTELSERQGWRVPRLEFVGTPLSEAIAMFNEHSARWHGVRIVLGDSKLARLQLSGILRADNTETLLRVLATEFGIKAERQGNDVIVLRGR